jgi:hypothetical protein
MAYLKVRWISAPTFLACVGGAHDRGEGANIREGAQTAKVEGANGRGGGGMHVLGERMRPGGSHMRPSASRMRPQQPPTIQYGSDVTMMWQPP